MTAKDYLKDIRKLDLEIQTLQEQISLLRKNAEGLRAMELSDMPKGGKGKDLSDYVAEIADLQMVCVQHVSELIMKKQEAIERIMSIDGSELRNVLLLRYIQCKEWDEIADKLQYNLRTIFRLHGEALKEFGDVVSNCQ
jgi:DNA-directed RNA polymerase specialized sigma24 family protein